MKTLVLISLLFTSFAYANESMIDSLKEGWYGTNSYACGRNVIVNRPAKKVYLELAGNPIHDYECNNINIPVAEAKCPDHTGQNCRIKNSAKIDILTDSLFIFTNPNSEQIIYRWVQ